MQSFSSVHPIPPFSFLSLSSQFSANLPPIFLNSLMIRRKPTPLLFLQDLIGTTDSAPLVLTPICVAMLSQKCVHTNHLKRKLIDCLRVLNFMTFTYMIFLNVSQIGLSYFLLFVTIINTIIVIITIIIITLILIILLLSSLLLPLLKEEEEQ